MKFSSPLGAIPICLALLLASGPAFAQAGLPTQMIPGQENSGISQQDQRPTPRNPRYVPPVLPEYMRNKLDPSTEFLVSPAGGMDMEQFLRARALMEAKKKRGGRYDARDFTDSADTPADRARFERDILRQFGVSSLPYRGQEEHRVGKTDRVESPARRFQIVFCLSMPFTLAFTYGIAAAANGSLGSSSVLNGPQTAGFVSSGLALSALIGWYDNVQWNKLRGKGGGFGDSLLGAAGNPGGFVGKRAQHRAGLLAIEAPGRRPFPRDLPLFQFGGTFRF